MSKRKYIFGNRVKDLTKKELEERIVMVYPTMGFRPNITKKQLLKIYKGL